MGHMGHLKQEYRSLVRRLDAGPVGMPEPDDEKAWQGWKDILEILYTPQQAELASKLPTVPSSLKKIARRIKVEPAELKPRLDAMCDKGLVMDLVDPRTGKTRYMLSPPVVGFFEFSLMRAHDSIPKKRMAEALAAYIDHDPTFFREVFGAETVVGRALVDEDVLADGLPDVLPWERATSLVEDASHRAVSYCYCRHKAEHLGKDCDTPKEICLSLNLGADFVTRRSFGRAVERSEALEILHQAREHGLVHIADNVQNRPAYICSCCGCCCGQLQSINQYDLPAVNPSGFEPISDEELCSGCARCARACPITAITMKASRQRSQRKNELAPDIDRDRCIGCGVCANACKKKAMRMHRRAERPYVPRSAIERAIRMSIERGRLAHLLADEGESRGYFFLNRALQVLTRLPPAERLLASEQVRSRFIRKALGVIPDSIGG